MEFTSLLFISILCRLSFGFKCPPWEKYGNAPSSSCKKPSDPNNKPPSKIEKWFTKEMFNDLFPKANLGWGPTESHPYNYESFIIAARYFPRFGAEYVEADPRGQPLDRYTEDETYKRDVAAFFAHSIQETGENDPYLYKTLPKEKADDCFYRGGFFNWFEGGPKSPYVINGGADPSDGKFCTTKGRYCSSGDQVTSYFYPCNNGKSEEWYLGCYFGRGSIQISYNYNYGLFNHWLKKQGVKHNNEDIDLLREPNLVATKIDPPLIIMASLWFYMTPQSPKPAMHDIVIGNWVSPDPDYAGAVFGPTSLAINNECNGEDPTDPGGPGESRRIKALRWFTKYFNIPFNIGDPKTLSCKEFNSGSRSFDFPKGTKIYKSWDIDYKTSWDENKPCTCVMKEYSGPIAAYDPKFMPQYGNENEENKKWCQQEYQNGYANQPCSKFKI